MPIREQEILNVELQLIHTLTRLCDNTNPDEIAENRPQLELIEAELETLRQEQAPENIHGNFF